MLTFHDYAVSRKPFPPLFMITTVVASFVGMGVILGTGEKATHAGFFPTYGLLGFVLQLFLSGLLWKKRARFLIQHTHEGGFIRDTYGTWYQVCKLLCWISLGFGILSAQLKGVSQLFMVFLPSLDPYFCTILGFITVLAYSFFGGMRAVVITDVFQCLIMLFVIPILAIFFVYHTSMQSFSDAILGKDFFIFPGWSALFSTFVGFLLGDAFIPPVVQRLHMCSTPKQAQRIMNIASVLCLMLVMASNFIGVGVSQHDTFTYDTPFLVALTRSLPSVWHIPMVVALLAAVMSSADSYLHNLSLASVDMIEKFKPLHEHQKLIYARTSMVLIGIGCVFFSFRFEKIYDMLLYSYKLWCPFVLLPLLGSLSGITLPLRYFKALLFVHALIIMVWHVKNIEALTGISETLPCIATTFFLHAAFWYQHQMKKI